MGASRAPRTRARTAPPARFASFRPNRIRSTRAKDIVMATRRSSSKSTAPNAVELLEEDHKRVQKIFKQVEKMDADEEALSALVAEAIAELKVHTQIEEQVFYPAAREALGDDEESEDLLNEAGVEHGSAKTLIEKLEGMDASDPYYRATFTVLGEYVNHHIKEEESEMFPRLKKAKMDLAGIAEEMIEAKQQARAELGLDTPGEEDAVEANTPAAEAKPPSQRGARNGR
jgi:hemerythrin-like domain-containing protein